MTGKVLNSRWQVGAKQALYRESGDWYHQLKKFPGALFDAKGYVLFQTEEEYRNCPYLQIRHDVHVRDGISSIPGYVQVVVDDHEHVPMKPLPEAVPEPHEHYEGSAYEVRLTVYERDPVARTQCLEYWGVRCHICEFSFADTYGAVGEGFIHVHHLTPLSQIRQEYQINPVKDLRPVCPNCHAIIHKRTLSYSVAEVKAMLQSEQRST